MDKIDNCYGSYNPRKKKCKSCQYAEYCKDSKDPTFIGNKQEPYFLDTTEEKPISLDDIFEKLHAIDKKQRLDYKLIQTIMRDMEQIRFSAPKQYQCLYHAIVDYPASYSAIAKKLGITRSTLYTQIKRAALRYPWAEGLRKARIWELADR